MRRVRTVGAFAISHGSDESEVQPALANGVRANMLGPEAIKLMSTVVYPASKLGRLIPLARCPELLGLAAVHVTALTRDIFVIVLAEHGQA